MNSEKQPRLLVSFVLANSCHMTTERRNQLAAAFAQWNAFAAAEANGRMQFEIVAYDDFTPTVVKAFDDSYQSAAFPEQGFPLANSALQLAVQNVLQKEADLDRQRIAHYKSWLVFLSDGQSVESTLPFKATMEKLSGTVLFLPFNLYGMELSENLLPVSQKKYFIKILNEQFGDMMKWLIGYASDRLAAPPDQSISISKYAFNGWAVIK